MALAKCQGNLLKIDGEMCENHLGVMYMPLTCIIAYC